MSNIIRQGSNARMSQIVIHNSTVYLAGQVGSVGETVTAQTQEVIAKIEALLAQAGSNKSRILQALIGLADMQDFDEMNTVWDTWLGAENAPARACGEAKLARPGLKVEITVIAAVN